MISFDKDVLEFLTLLPRRTKKVSDNYYLICPNHSLTNWLSMNIKAKTIQWDSLKREYDTPLTIADLIDLLPQLKDIGLHNE